MTEEIQATLAEMLGVDQATLPQLRIIQRKPDLFKYKYESNLGAISVEAITKFVNDFKEDKLSPYLKSDEAPDIMTNDGLTVVVGDTFDYVVNDDVRDIFVKYYAPWCSHCIALAPVWSELAQEVEDIEDLVIAIFDAVGNEAPKVHIEHYPTFIFYPKDDKSGIVYEGNHDPEEFRKFLYEHSTAYEALREPVEEID